MTRRLFPEGGPHHFRETTPGRIEASIQLQPDAHGMLARACPDEACAPGYFKVKPGTGLTAPGLTYCPYCGRSAAPKAFPSKAQLEYGRAVVLDEAKQGVRDIIRAALGLDGSGRRSFGGGFITMKMELKPVPLQPVVQPAEEELRRELTCPHCGLMHAVFGLASVCPDCGRQIVSTHVREELAVVRKILDALPGRLESLGPRIAARDLENALEDVVSIFEAAMKFVTRKSLLAQGRSPADIDELFRKQVRNEYQNVASAARVYEALVQGELFSCLTPAELAILTDTFEKRHPITHNLGIVDRKYMRKAAQGELEGREVRVTADEVRAAIDMIERIVEDAYQKVLGHIAVASPLAEAYPSAAPYSVARDSVMEGLSPAAHAIAEHLVRHSELGHDRDPRIPISELALHLQLPLADMWDGAGELKAIDGIWIEEPLPNSRDQIAPRAKLFELCDQAWMGWNVREDALTLAKAAIQKETLIIPEEAQARDWSPRRMNPALEFLLARGIADEDCYAHPFAVYRIHDNERIRAFVAEVGPIDPGDASA
jgi:hypothetical protein